MGVKGFVIGGAIGVGIGLIASKFKAKPASAAEISQRRFNPYADDFTHPFYQQWADVGENLENFEKFVNAFASYGMSRVEKKPLTEMTDRDTIIVKIAALRDFIQESMAAAPADFAKATRTSMDVDVNTATGECILTDPYEGKSPKDLKPNETIERTSIINSIQKNKTNLYKAHREIAAKLMHSLLYDRNIAEVTVKLVTGSDLSIDDLSDKDLDDIWDAIDLLLHHILVSKTNILSRVCESYINMIP